jgi:hypothetical protein
MGVTPAAAAANIRKLESAGILIPWANRKRGQIFVALGILDFIQDADEPGRDLDGHRDTRPAQTPQTINNPG